MDNRQISPSILDVKSDQLISYVNSLIKWGVSNVHYDVMDAQFVPNTALTYEEIKKIFDKCPKHHMDIHLMVKDVFSYYHKFKEFGAILTFHYEAFENEIELKKLIKLAKKEDIKLGLAFNPDTDVSRVMPFLKDLDLILAMSVYPGKGGQSFIESTYAKVRQLRKYIDQKNLKIIIEIDGGIKDFNIKKCFESGVDLAVVGSYLVKNFSKETIKLLLS
ncbi:ribulose-phosphate 3-epimerase [Mycoplasma sp. 327]